MKIGLCGARTRAGRATVFALILGLVMVLLPVSGQAQSEDGDGKRERALATWMIGVLSRPDYLGSSQNQALPDFRLNFNYFDFLGLNFGDPAIEDDPFALPPGLVPRLSLRTVSTRDDSNGLEFVPLNDIDAAIEIGVGAKYVWEDFELIGDFRYGVTGHESWVGEFRAYYIAEPADRFVMRIGPRVVYGSEKFNQTYFGITPAEAAASGFPAYNPGSGPVTYGLEVIANYRTGKRTWLEVGARYDRFQGDVANSPIIDLGSDTQAEFRVGLRRALSLRF